MNKWVDVYLESHTPWRKNPRVSLAGSSQPQVWAHPGSHPLTPWSVEVTSLCTQGCPHPATISCPRSGRAHHPFHNFLVACSHLPARRASFQLSYHLASDPALVWRSLASAWTPWLLSPEWLQLPSSHWKFQPWVADLQLCCVLSLGSHSLL